MRHLVYIFASLLAAGPALASDGAATREAAITVDAIIQAGFRRVPGPAAGQAVLDTGPPESWYGQSVSLPTVDFDGKLYRMWFVGSTMTSDPGIPYGWYERVGLATTTDGIHWTRANHGDPVMDIGKPGSIDTIQATGVFVMRKDGKFAMWYGAYNGRHTLGMAASPDGIHWTKANGGKSLSGLRGREQLGPSIYFDRHRYLMLYNHGLRPASGGGLWLIHAATSRDGVQWQPAFEDKPLLGPAPPDNFASADGKKGNNHSVHPTKMVLLAGRARVWYGGEANTPRPGQKYPPCRIGLMEARILEPRPDPADE